MTKLAPFNAAEASEKIQNFEAATGRELIVVACGSSDPYPGASWRGGLLLSLLATGIFTYFFELEPHVLEILMVGVGAWIFQLLLHFTGAQMFFALAKEKERETAEKASDFFQRFQSNQLAHQASVLLFFSLAERQIHLLVDRDLKDKLSTEDLLEIVTLLQMHFKRQSFGAGLGAGIELLQKKVLEKAGKNPHPSSNDVPDRVFWMAKPW